METKKFPPIENGVTDAEGILRYIRQENSKSTAKVRVWRQQRKPMPLEISSKKMIIQFVLEDVMTAYLMLVCNFEKRMIVETVSTFGPRENVGNTLTDLSEMTLDINNITCDLCYSFLFLSF
jgi:hypothetical protein